MYPNSSFDGHLLHKIINFAYWPVFGTIRLFDELDKINCEGPSCPEKSGVVLSIILTMIYMVLTNILLVNLLIAMFS